jgi:hypothetical protein
LQCRSLVNRKICGCAAEHDRLILISILLDRAKRKGESCLRALLAAANKEDLLRYG